MTNEKKKSESHYRSVIKGISWRAVGTLDTILLSYVITGNPENALKIGFTEVISKIVIYWFHERIWQWILLDKKQTRKNTLIKTVTWRVVGSIDTMVLGWIYTGSLQTGLSIATFEVITKVILYYFHERLWLKVPKGSIRESFKFKK